MKSLTFIRSVRSFGGEASLLILYRPDRSSSDIAEKMAGGVMTNKKSVRPSLAAELVLALSKPRSSKEPRGTISKNSGRTNNDDWINFLKKKKDNLTELEGRDRVTKLEQSLKEEREKLRRSEETLHKEQLAHNETKRKSGNNAGQNVDSRNLLAQEKIKNKGLLDELSSLRKKTDNLGAKNEERIKELQRENARTVLEVKELKAWKEEALSKMSASAKFCESHHTSQIEKLRLENSNLQNLCDENSLKVKKMVKELSVSLKKKEFEIELLKGDLEKKNQIIHNMRTELDEMCVNKNINEGNDKSMTSAENVRQVPNKTIASPNTSTLKKRKRFPMESFVSVKKARADDKSCRELINELNEGPLKYLKQEMVVFDETIGPEEAVATCGDFVEDILEEILENIDYNKQKEERKTLEDATVIIDFSSGDTLVENDSDIWLIRELIFNMIDNL